MAQSLASKYLRSAVGLALLATTAACARMPQMETSPQDAGSQPIDTSSITARFKASCQGELTSYPYAMAAGCVTPDAKGLLLGQDITTTRVYPIAPTADLTDPVQGEAFRKANLELFAENQAKQGTFTQRGYGSRSSQGSDPCARKTGLDYGICEANSAASTAQQAVSTGRRILSLPSQVGGILNQLTR